MFRVIAIFAAASVWAGGSAFAPQPARAEDTRFMLCAELPYRSCVHSAELIYLRGDPIRLSDVMAPDRYASNCAEESRVAWIGAQRLRDILNQGPFDVVEDPAREAMDGPELLRRIERDGISVGDTLVSEGLARRWTLQGTTWCTAGK